MSMTIERLPLRDLRLAKSTLRKDHRGAFLRLFCEEELSELLEGRRIVQINRSITNAVGAVRGMHFQRPPFAEMKLVRCLRGRVWDVAVDLRDGAYRWHAEELSADDCKMLVIPEGFAHGFQVLEPESELLYLHTAAYHPEAEGGLHPLDPTLDIPWPLKVTELSKRDESHPLLVGALQ